VTSGLNNQARAIDPPGASTNAAAATAPDATQKSKTSRQAEPPASTPTTAPAVKPAAIPSTASATSRDEPIGGLSIDDLLNVTVTSAGQKEQKLSDVAAAITVLNSDDIRRSGATTIPDLLRYVPGVEVQQANNSDTSVAVRGFGGIFSSKLLVLIDGRSIYNPAFSGVQWQYEQVMMENIDRVEVIRGPGATIWGANAVNGVINIITKDAADTQGGLISSSYGTKEDGMGEFRYGFQPTNGLSLRMYGQYQNVGADNALPGVENYDALQNGTIGFRADYRPDSDDHFLLSSDASQTRAGDEQSGFLARPAFTQLEDAENVNFVYEHNFETDNELTVQSYYDRTAQSSAPPDVFVNTVVQTADVQIRHTLPLNLLPIEQELTYGAEYRQVDSQFGDTESLHWLGGRDDQTFSAFAQTDLHLVDDLLILTMGTKLDHNDYTGFEIQPSARLLWKLDSRNSLWWSVSRAVREPSIIEYESIPPGNITGNMNLKSEALIAYEMGYRVEPTQNLSIDIAAFYNDYTDLIQGYLIPGSFAPTFEQFQKAQTYGIEPSFDAQLQPWWNLSGSYSLLKFHVDNSAVPVGDTFAGAGALDTLDPTNEFSLRSSFDLPNNVDIDLGGRYVDKVAAANGYFAADVRVTWRPTKNWEVSVVGQNLLSAGHLENPGQFVNTTYVGPEVYAKIVFNF